MIVEIALGIVLAVLILMFLGPILALAGIMLGLVIVLAIIAAVIYFVFAEPSVFFAVLGVAVIIIGGAYLLEKIYLTLKWRWIARRYEKGTVWPKGYPIAREGEMARRIALGYEPAAQKEPGHTEATLKNGEPQTLVSGVHDNDRPR